MRLPDPLGPRPQPCLSGRRSPAAAPPPPWRRSGRSAPPLDHCGSGSLGPTARTFKLETSREAEPQPRDRAPPPEVGWPSRDLGSAPPLGCERSAPGTLLLNPRPPRLPGSHVPRALGPSAPFLRPQFRLGVTLKPAPGQKGRKGHFLGRGSLAALRGGRVAIAPPAGRGTLPERPARSSPAQRLPPSPATTWFPPRSFS